MLNKPKINITPYPKNAKKHPQKQIDLIKKSIQEFGMNQPIVVDTHGIIIVGHGRFEALKQLGLELKDEWIKVVDLTEEQAKAYRLADNKLNESEWDMGLVIEELKGLSAEMLDLTGFESDLIIELDDKDDVTPENAPPVAKLGDVWALGRHRLMCGDSTSKEAVETLLNGVKPNLMVTDPPYGVDYNPEWREGADLGVGERSKGKVLNDKQVDWTEAYSLFEGAIAYVWHAGIYSHIVAKNLEDCGFKIASQIIWAKQHFVLSRGDYHWQHEPCWYAVKKGNTHSWTGDRKQTTIWNIKNNNSFGNADKEKTWGHGTQKPVECMLRPILNNSNEGQGVYDPFGGSGTTLIAAEKTNRICYMLELDPKYCDVIIKRYEDYTGNKAEKINE